VKEEKEGKEEKRTKNRAKRKRASKQSALLSPRLQAEEGRRQPPRRGAPRTRRRVRASPRRQPCTLTAHPDA